MRDLSEAVECDTTTHEPLEAKLTTALYFVSARAPFIDPQDLCVREKDAFTRWTTGANLSQLRSPDQEHGCEWGLWRVSSRERGKCILGELVLDGGRGGS